MQTPSYYNYVNPIWKWLWAHGWEGPGNPGDPAGLIRAAAEKAAAEPEPNPWRVAVPQLLEAIQARDIALKLEGRRKDEAVRTANHAIASILDDWCGTPPRKYPWPWPGPPPWTWEIVSALTLAANSLHPGSLRDGVQDVANQLAKKAAGEPIAS